MKKDQIKNRLQFVTLLRGLAALCVASGHLFSLAINLPVHPNLLITILLFPTKFGQYSVYLFLTLSGYSLLRSERFRRSQLFQSTHFATYLRRRFWRIVPVYYFSIIFGLLVTLLLRTQLALPSPDITFPGVFTHFIFLNSLNEKWRYQTNPALWTIAAEMQCYITLPLILRCKSFKTVLLTTFLTFFVIKVFVHVTNFGLFALIYFFLLGVIIGEFSLRYRIKSSFLIVILSITSILVFSEYIGHYGKIIELILWLLFFSTLFLLLEALELKHKLNNSLRIIGISSYSLYACHYPIVYCTWWLVSKLTSSYVLQLLLLGCIGIPLITLGTYVTYRFIEKPSLEKVRLI